MSVRENELMAGMLTQLKRIADAAAPTDALEDIKIQLRVVTGLLITMSEFLAPGELEQFIKHGAEKADDKEYRQVCRNLLKRYYEPEQAD